MGKEGAKEDIPACGESWAGVRPRAERRTCWAAGRGMLLTCQKEFYQFHRRPTLTQGRAQAEQHSRVICHMGLGGKSYALDFWSRVSEINRVSAKVLPFPPRLPSAEPKKPAKRRAGGRKERASKPNS